MKRVVHREKKGCGVFFFHKNPKCRAACTTQIRLLAAGCSDATKKKMLPPSLIPPKAARVVERLKRTEIVRDAEDVALEEDTMKRVQCDEDAPTDELEISVDDSWDNTKTIKQLRDRCVELDLPSTGRKAELLERLKQHATPQ